MFEWGALLVTLSASGGVLTTLIATAGNWINRRAGNHRLKITINGDTLELGHASTSEQAAL